MRVLFFNEGNMGTYIMGQGQLEGALRMGVEATPELEARFAGLTPMTRAVDALATRRIQPLARLDLDVDMLRWQLVQSTRARRALRRELASWTPDVLHVHTQSVALTLPRSGSWLPPLAISMDTTIRDWWEMPAWHRPRAHSGALIAPSRALERRALRRAAVVLAWTGWARRGAEREAPGARVEEHHPGIDLERFAPAERRERQRPRVLFVGGRFAEKGGEDLLAALAPELGRGVELDIVTPAEVPEREGLRVHRLEPSDPRLLDLQQQADLLCLPTYGDAAPWAVLEAMACGTPVIASDVGGLPDMLAGGAGMLVKHGDVRGLREALLALLEDRKRRDELAAAARARCEACYDARKQFGRLLELLRSARNPGLGGDV
jgi:glycosyltransferase involved in cell wall biosynthesis